MKIVILDGHALNPGDLSYDVLNEFGEVVYYPRTSSELTLERIGDAEIVFLNKVNLTREILSQCKNLKYVGVFATGYNVVDIEAAREFGIVVTNIPSYSTMAVAQAVFALIMEFTNNVSEHSKSVMNGDWINAKDFCYWISPLTELYNKTIGLIGFGSIGQRVAKIASSYGMKVIVHTRTESKVTEYNKNVHEDEKVKFVTLDELLSTSDIVSLHCPLKNENKGLINSDALKKIKDGALLINTARGPLVDEQAVRDALDNGKLRGYATDVLSSEPMSEDCPLLKAKNCVITPHVAWAAKETRERLLSIAVENLRSFLNGKVINRVN